MDEHASPPVGAQHPAPSAARRGDGPPVTDRPCDTRARARARGVPLVRPARPRPGIRGRAAAGARLGRADPRRPRAPRRPRGRRPRRGLHRRAAHPAGLAPRHPHRRPRVPRLPGRRDPRRVPRRGRHPQGAGTRRAVRLGAVAAAALVVATIALQGSAAWVGWNAYDLVSGVFAGRRAADPGPTGVTAAPPSPRAARRPTWPREPADRRPSPIRRRDVARARILRRRRRRSGDRLAGRGDRLAGRGDRRGRGDRGRDRLPAPGASGDAVAWASPVPSVVEISPVAVAGGRGDAVLGEGRPARPAHPRR